MSLCLEKLLARIQVLLVEALKAWELNMRGSFQRVSPPRIFGPLRSIVVFAPFRPLAATLWYDLDFGLTLAS
jgi:hypothetical protein